MKKLRLHLAELEDFSPEVYQTLEQRFTLSTGPLTQSELKGVLEEVDIFWFRLAYRVGEADLSVDTRCKFIVTPVTGIDHIDEQACSRQGISIICLRGETAFLQTVRATAEHTILLTMMVMRHATQATYNVLGGHWTRDNYRGHELYGKKVGIIGLGRLGTIVAGYFETMGCQVGYFDPYVDSDGGYERYITLVECVKSVDIVSLHVKYDGTTHHLINDTVTQHFQPHQYLINTSRGQVIDESALLSALQSRRLAGAALDVLEGEPITNDNPLVAFARDNGNLVITPHIGGCTFESFSKTEKFVLSKLLQKVTYAEV